MASLVGLGDFALTRWVSRKDAKNPKDAKRRRCELRSELDASRVL